MSDGIQAVLIGIAAISVFMVGMIYLAVSADMYIFSQKLIILQEHGIDKELLKEIAKLLN